MNLQGPEPILPPRPAALTSAPELQTKPGDGAMNTEFENNFDPSGDILEFGLMATASPDFADRLIRALRAEADSSGADDESVFAEHGCQPNS